MKEEEKNTNLSEKGRDTEETDCPEAQVTLISTEVARRNEWKEDTGRTRYVGSYPGKVRRSKCLEEEMSRRKSGQRPPDVRGDMVGDSRQKIAGKARCWMAR